MTDEDWLDILTAGLREERPAWAYWQDEREFGDVGTRRCLVFGPWDTKVVLDGDRLRVYFGCHRFQHQLFIGDPRVIEKIILRGEVDAAAGFP